jgi:hypothetical protein
MELVNHITFRCLVFRRLSWRAPGYALQPCKQLRVLLISVDDFPRAEILSVSTSNYSSF